MPNHRQNENIALDVLAMLTVLLMLALMIAGCCRALIIGATG